MKDSLSQNSEDKEQVMLKHHFEQASGIEKESNNNLTKIINLSLSNTNWWGYSTYCF